MKYGQKMNPDSKKGKLFNLWSVNKTNGHQTNYKIDAVKLP